MIPLTDTKDVKRLLIVIIAGFAFSTLTGAVALRAWLSSYPVIKTSDRLNNQIAEITGYQSSRLVSLDDGRKLTLTSLRNYKYSPHDLNEFLKEGDHLLKHPNSNTVIIVRNKCKYIFVIGAFLNRSSRKQ